MKIHIWVVEKNLHALVQWIKHVERGEIFSVEPPLFHTFSPGANYVELSISYDVFVALKDNERKK